jgi:hypothetical protein
MGIRIENFTKEPPITGNSLGYSHTLPVLLTLHYSFPRAKEQEL